MTLERNLRATRNATQLGGCADQRQFFFESV